MIAKSLIGAYGPWAASLAGKGPALLSFRQPRFTSVAAWKRQAVAKVQDLAAEPEAPWRVRVRVERQFEYDGLHVEQLSWQLPYGPRTEALFLEPAGTRGRLPAVLALHDHGGNKYFGVRKITRVADGQHPLNDTEDSLFTLPEMQAADRMLRQVYRKAGAAKDYRCQFYPGGHKFDLCMQRDAFNWLDAMMGK